jgi:hypothetical protein
MAKMTRLYMGFRTAGLSQRLYQRGRRESRICQPARSGEDVLTDFSEGKAFHVLLLRLYSAQAEAPSLE